MRLTDIYCDVCGDHLAASEHPGWHAMALIQEDETDLDSHDSYDLCPTCAMSLTAAIANLKSHFTKH